MSRKIAQGRIKGAGFKGCRVVERRRARRPIGCGERREQCEEGEEAKHGGTIDRFMGVAIGLTVRCCLATLVP